MSLNIEAMGCRPIVGQRTPVSELVHAWEVVEPLLVLLEAALLAVYVRTLRRGKSEATMSARMLSSGS